MSIRPIMKTHSQTLGAVVSAVILVVIFIGLYNFFENKYGREAKLKYYNTCITEALGDDKSGVVSPVLMTACRENAKFFFSR